MSEILVSFKYSVQQGNFNASYYLTLILSGFRDLFLTKPKEAKRVAQLGVILGDIYSKNSCLHYLIMVSNGFDIDLFNTKQSKNATDLIKNLEQLKKLLNLYYKDLPTNTKEFIENTNPELNKNPRLFKLSIEKLKIDLKNINLNSFKVTSLEVLYKEFERIFNEMNNILSCNYQFNCDEGRLLKKIAINERNPIFENKNVESISFSFS